MAIGTLNVRRLATAERLVELQAELKEINIDVLALTELRWRGCGALDLTDSEFTFYYAGPEDRTDASGTGFLLNRRLQSHFRQFRRVGPRISLMDLQFGQHILRLFSVYAPPTGSRSTEDTDEDDEEEDAYEELLEMIRAELRSVGMSGWERGAISSGTGVIARRMRVHPVLLGDLNAKMGRRTDEEELALGNFGYGDRNWRGQLLVDLCEDFRLRSVNSDFKARPGRKWTWMSPDRRTRNCIDYILAPRSIGFSSSSVLGSNNAGSDHRIVRAIIQSPTSSSRREPPNLKNRKRLNQDMFKMVTAANPPMIDPASPNAYMDLVKYIQEAADFAEEPEVKKGRLTPSTVALLQQRRDLRRQQATTVDRIAFAELNKLVRREMRKDINKHHSQLVEEAVRNVKGLRKVQGAVATGRRRIIQLRDRDGILCSTTTHLRRIVQEFYEDLYASSVHVERETQPETEECLEFLESEVEEALRKMKTGRSPGIDKVTVEMLKLGKSTFLRPLTAMFNRCLRLCEAPEKLADSSTVLLFKKGDPFLVKNYRPISLLSVILDSAQTPEQAGFRKNYSTVDHRMPVFIAFIDYEKAFDSVEANAVWNAVQRQGVPMPIINLLQKLYDEAASHVTIEEKRVPIEIRRGVRQGDCISPKLFTAVLEEIFRELRFADDVVLIAKTEEELQKMIEELNEVSLRSGLKMNKAKTKILATDETTIRLNGEEIEQVEAFVYLGQEVRIARNHAKEVGRRIRCGWSVFRRYQEFLTSKTVQMRWKRRLHDQCILPAMLYGCETWALTQTAQRKLAAGQRRMERRVVGVRLPDKKSNDWLRGVTKFTDVVEAAKKRKWNYAWKLANEASGKWSRQLEEWHPPVTRPLGRPRTRWRDDFAKKLGTARWQQRAREESHQEWANNGV